MIGLITELFRSEPYSKKRYDLSEELEKLENELNIRTNYHIDTKKKIVKVDILKRNKGLYETIKSFEIDNIKIWEGGK